MGLFSVVRWVRATSFAATCAGLATLAHLAGGGCFAPLPVLSGFLLIMLPALVLTGRERTLTDILPATALSQVMLHALLTSSTDQQAMTAMAGMTGMEHHHHAPSLSLTLGMLLMHGAGVVVTSVWLRWIEAGLCALARQLAGWVLRPLLALLFVAAGWAFPGRQAVGYADETAPVRLFLRYALLRRGPPGMQAEPAV
jgi:hypothetical protein